MSGSVYVYANRDTSDMLELGPAGGAFFILLGLLVCLCALAVTAWWFWMQARDHPRQPAKYRPFNNIGLLTVLPTLGLFAISYYGIIMDDRYSYGPTDVVDLLGAALAVFILLYAVVRGDCQESAKKLPPVLALSLVLAAGLALTENGTASPWQGLQRHGQLDGHDGLGSHR
jgi:hypothetical protein